MYHHSSARRTVTARLCSAASEAQRAAPPPPGPAPPRNFRALHQAPAGCHREASAQPYHSTSCAFSSGGSSPPRVLAGCYAIGPRLCRIAAVPRPPHLQQLECMKHPPLLMGPAASCHCKACNQRAICRCLRCARNRLYQTSLVPRRASGALVACALLDINAAAAAAVHPTRREQRKRASTSTRSDAHVWSVGNVCARQSNTRQFKLLIPLLVAKIETFERVLRQHTDERTDHWRQGSDYVSGAPALAPVYTAVSAAVPRHRPHRCQRCSIALRRATPRERFSAS